MPVEREGRGVPLSSIHIDFQERSILLEAEDRSATKITLAPEGIIYEQRPRGAVPAPGQSGEAAALPAGGEKEKTVTLSGRLKSAIKEGKPDRSGNPTAWARFAAHEEGRADAHLYLATFHRHTARIALALASDSQITVEGYAHPSEDPAGKRLDTFSVINLPHYPGKETKR